MPSFTCSVSALAPALRDTAAITDRKSAIDIMSSLLIDAKDGLVSITGCTFDTWLERRVAAETDKAIRVCIDASRLAAVVGAFDSSAQVQFTLTDKTMLVTSGRAKFKFGVLPDKGFPLPQKVDATPVEFGPEILSALRFVAHAQGVDATRYYLNGTAFQVRDGQLHIVATDGNRLASVGLPFAGEISDTIMPLSLAALISKEAGDFKLSMTADRFSVEFPGATITGKSIDATYPAWQKVIPSKSDRSVLVSSTDVLSALSRVGLVAEGKDQILRFSFDTDKMTISGRVDGSEGSEEVPCSYDGDPFEIGFRAKLIKDELSAVDGADVEMAMSGPADPVQIIAKSLPNVKIVLMPVRI